MAALGPHRASTASARPTASVERLAPWFALAVSLAIVIAAATLGSRAVGGSDSHCFVAQARMYAEGRTALPPPLREPVPWPDAPATFAPSGFAPKAGSSSSIPLCPAGLPYLMLIAMTLGGQAAWFWVVPLMGAITIWSTYRLGVRLATPTVGVAGAILLASSPTFLLQVLQPMSDVPAAALWTAALALATRHLQQPGATAPRRATAWPDVAVGLVTGAAITVRPNLAPLAVFPVLLVLAGPAAHRWRHAALAALAVLPGVVAVAGQQSLVYGSPLASGYGDLSLLFAWANVGPNLGRYLSWMWQSHHLAFLPSLAAPFVSRPRWPLAAILAFACATLALYLPYVQFEDWTYTRFLLPAFPAAFVLGAIVIEQLARRLARAWTPAVVLAVALLAAASLLVSARAHRVFTIGADEHRYAVLGTWTAGHLPRNAVVLAAMPAGTIRHYAGLPTLSWDAIQPSWLDRVVAHLQAQGLEPYLVLDSWERDPFRARFRSASPRGELDWPPRATIGRAMAVYHLDDRPRYLAGASIPVERVPVTRER